MSNKIQTFDKDGKPLGKKEVFVGLDYTFIENDPVMGNAVGSFPEIIPVRKKGFFIRGKDLLKNLLNQWKKNPEVKERLKDNSRFNSDDSTQ